MSSISAGTTTTTAFKITSDTTGSLVLKTGASGVTAVDIDAAQVVTIGNIAVTGGAINNTVIGGTTAAAGTFTTLSAASTVTFNGGTANGVAYLNGSKNLTTGSALTFDGTTLANINSDGTGFSTQSAASNFSIMRFGTDSVNGYAFFQSGKSGTGTTLPFAWRQDSSELMRLTSTGLGITVGNAPTQALNLYRTGSTQTVMAAGNSNTGLNGTYFGVDTAGNGIVNTTGAFATIFSNNGSERARITSAGNFGIGTTSPSYPLQVRRPGGACSLGLTMDNYGAIAELARSIFYYAIGDSTTDRTGHLFFTRDATATDNLRLVINSAGDVGIGTASPGTRLEVRKDVDATTSLAPTSVKLYNNSDGGAGIEFGNAVSGKSKISFGVESTGAGTDDSYIGFSTSQNAAALSERARITSGGNFQVNNGQVIVSAGSGDSYSARLSCAYNFPTVDTYLDSYAGASWSGQIMFRTNSGGGAMSERARILSSGEFLVGRTTTIGSSFMCVQGGPIGWVGNSSGVDGTYIDWLVCASYSPSTTEQHRVRASISGTAGSSGIQFMISNGAGLSTQTESFRINRTSCTVVGSLSKGSGSFKIDHPLKPDTHHLVHSFIEGPQADLIYRGKAALVNGRAEVNIDTAAGMTEGTFVALCREVQCFTSNESDWDAVRGSVLGNVLTIECQNQNSSATISWMVIGERQDKHMYDTEWTDDDGKVIVEPLKELH